MDGKYTFEEFYKNLEDGYQIYFTYVRNRYLLFKTSENCYTQQLLTVHDKNPQPRHSMITFKRVKEMFPHMEEIEYNNTEKQELTMIEFSKQNGFLTFVRKSDIIYLS